jgi:hypothetical protein
MGFSPWDFLAIVAVVLFLTEGVTEASTSALLEAAKVRIPWPLVAGVVASGLAWAFDLRLLTAIGIPTISWVEYAVVAIVGSRRSGWLHDLIALTQKKKAEAIPTTTTEIK